MLADIVGIPRLPEVPVAKAPTLQALAERTEAGEHDLAPEHKRHDSPEQTLDPIVRQAAQLAPPQTMAMHTEPERAPMARAQLSLEDLVPQLVKKIAWSGDVHHGTVHMELGAGELAGSSLTVTANDGRISVQLRAPAGTDVVRWKERLASRLGARGLSIDTLEVI